MKKTTRLRLPNGLVLPITDQHAKGAARFAIGEIFKGRQYVIPGYRYPEDATIVDVGANMGIFALWAAPQVPAGRVIAIEPGPVIEMLEAAISCNSIENIFPVQSAVGRENEEMILKVYPGFNLVSHRVGWEPMGITRFAIRLLYGKYQTDPVEIRVKTRSLASIIEEYNLQRIDVLKVDCEGGEYIIFEEMKKETFQIINHIVMEFHELEKERSYKELVSILENNHFSVNVRKPFIDYRLMHYGKIIASRKKTNF